MTTSNAEQVSIPYLIPMLTVKDINSSLEFYQQAFGFTGGTAIDDDSGLPSYADMQYQDQLLIMLMRQGAWDSSAKTAKESGVDSPVGLYVYCDNVNSLYLQTQSAGARTVSEPQNMFWGDRVTQLLDADGHSWSFATRMDKIEASDASNNA